MAHIGQALAQLSPGAGGARDVVELARPHDHQGQRRAQEGQGVDEEDPPGAHPGDDQAAGGGPEQARRVEGRGIEADGVGQAVRRDHAGDEDLAGGRVVGDGEPRGDGGEVHVPQPGAPDEDVQPEHQRDQAHRALGDDEQAALVHAVGDEAGVDGEEQRRQELERRGQAGGGGGVVGQDAQDEPVLGHALHPGAGVRDQGREEPDPVVVEPQ